VGAVWQRIMAIDFTAITTYDANIKGILSFEQDLLA